MEEDKITIIEGPTPVFEPIADGWALGLNESPILYDLALTRLRTYNGSALVERCVRAWKNNSTINLHYRDTMGLEERTPIYAARTVEMDEGQVILLWVRHQFQESELDSGAEDLPPDSNFDI